MERASALFFRIRFRYRVRGPHSSSKPSALSCSGLVDEVQSKSEEGHQGKTFGRA